VADWKRRNLFIGGMPQEIDEHMLRTIFAEFGEIESVHINYSQRVYFENQ
jgi:RNA recognition motif-containing protein